jgi:hypothetical protein
MAPGGPGPRRKRSRMTALAHIPSWYCPSVPGRGRRRHFPAGRSAFHRIRESIHSGPGWCHSSTLSDQIKSILRAKLLRASTLMPSDCTNTIQFIRNETGNFEFEDAVLNLICLINFICKSPA